MSETIKIDSDYIKLDSFLKLANLVMSGGEAKLLIQEGQLKVNGEIETRRGRKLYAGDRVEVAGRGSAVVG
ncbi:S4 domain-containing protein YaaA [Trichlorobacter ammonificans]|uniref:Ribosome maturation protein RlbA n=1 Tax=Trichlorobacter ammonificans TaxID=2916410 RepID=A0ABN8HLN8_9BACT|nr:S4 domain-containing protein YaaA [Trichlorobacter ammonificans]CAH2032267.1 putative ribosome maturation protein RlbA [Trichlorobacter ammonificans]